jgi:hypothetical protein
MFSLSHPGFDPDNHPRPGCAADNRRQHDGSEPELRIRRLPMHARLDLGAVPAPDTLWARLGVNIRPSPRPSHHSRPGRPMRDASIRLTPRGTGLQSTLRWSK